jgi:orotate phosphoribosyltransferase
VEGAKLVTNDQALALFEQAGALLKGHFKLSSGLHSDQYLEKFRLAENPRLLEPMCEEIARRFAEDEIEIVLGPTTAGIILAYNVARFLGVEARYAEREDSRMTLRRNQSLTPGTRVLIVDDILTTGGAVKECIDVVHRSEATLAGLGVLGDRSGGTLDLGARLEALLTVKVEAYPQDTCPQCLEGIPIYQPGTKKLAV